ncbi:MAG: nitronate monooxygenase [Gammaproteobacteria bacterium]|nr:nitronate monooxygenase [Gammaproteobacteria bacterium]
MNNELCQRLGIELPIFAFTHCRDVVVAVSRAGGIGVLGAAGFTPEQLKQELDWISAQLGDRPFGIDVIMPKNLESGEVPDLKAMIPERHKAWIEDVLARHGVAPLPVEADAGAHHGISGEQIGWTHELCRRLLDVAFGYPGVKLMVNALGTPPADVLAECRERDILVGALAGKVKHALAHKQDGVDFVIAQGHEAGGHTGEITTMVLVPQVVDAVAPLPVLAAGGIANGRQVAAAMALGAAGVWCGSVWLTTPESEVAPLPRRKLLAAGSDATVRSRVISGKPARMLRSGWTDAWEAPDCPGFLPLPLQGMLTHEAHRRIARSQNEALAFYPCGQTIGLCNDERDCRTVIADMLNEYVATVERLGSSLADGD